MAYRRRSRRRVTLSRGFKPRRMGRRGRSIRRQTRGLRIGYRW